MANNQKLIKVIKGTAYDSPSAPKVWVFLGAPLETRDVFHALNGRYPAERDVMKRCHWSRPRKAWYTYEDATLNAAKELLSQHGFSVEISK